MNRAFTAWIWSLVVVARSLVTVFVLAVLMALWGLAAYEWLGLPESSGLLLILAFIWAAGQFVATVLIMGGTVSGAAAVAVAEGRSLPVRSLWTLNRKQFAQALIFSFGGLLLVLLCRVTFDWINVHSIEVASFLAFHSEKAISHVPVEEIYEVIEGLLWIVVTGFLLSLFIVLMRGGWREAGKQKWKLLVGCVSGVPFLTGLLSTLVLGGIAYKLATFHPVVPPGFWDYTQMIGRFSLVLILIAAGVLFWSFALARLLFPGQKTPEVT
jgi:hypothetical protein